MGDMTDWLLTVVPEKRRYRHHSWFDRRVNRYAVDAWAHIRSSFLLHSSITLPIHRRSLVLGRNQRVFFVELNSPRVRHLVIQSLGE